MIGHSKTLFLESKFTCKHNFFKIMSQKDVALLLSKSVCKIIHIYVIEFFLKVH